MCREDAHRWKPLNVWNRFAPRVYIRMVLCFGFDNKKEAAAVKHLRTCITDLGRKRPILRSLLKIDEPFPFVSTESHHNIPLEVHHIEREFGHDYEYLKRRSFPASAFTNKVFDVPVGNIAHALIVRMYIIDGGLILGLHVHHTLGDAHIIDDLISWLSAETRGDTTYDNKPINLLTPSLEAQYPPKEISEMHLTTPEEVKQRFPERTLVSQSPSMPATERYTGKIFTFDIEALEKGRSLYQDLEKPGRPSTNTLIFAYIWAHVTKARLAASLAPIKAIYTQGKNDLEPSRVFILIDFRNRAFTEEIADQYFGNAVEATVASLPTSSLLATCNGSSLKRLKPIVQLIQESIQSVDKAYVMERHDFYSRLSTSQALTIDNFPADRRALIFNSWRYVGMNKHQKWKIPGLVDDGYPDRVRRAGGTWNLSAAMVMPQPPGSQEVEVMITIEEDAMYLLLKDQEFIKLVNRVID